MLEKPVFTLFTFDEEGLDDLNDSKFDDTLSFTRLANDLIFPKLKDMKK